MLAVAVASAIVLSATGLVRSDAGAADTPRRGGSCAVTPTTSPVLDDYEFLEYSVGVLGRVAPAPGC